MRVRSGRSILTPRWPQSSFRPKNGVGREQGSRTKSPRSPYLTNHRDRSGRWWQESVRYRRSESVHEFNRSNPNYNQFWRSIAWSASPREMSSGIDPGNRSRYQWSFCLQLARFRRSERSIRWGRSPGLRWGQRFLQGLRLPLAASMTVDVRHARGGRAY